MINVVFFLPFLQRYLYDDTSNSDLLYIPIYLIDTATDHKDDLRQ